MGWKSYGLQLMAFINTGRGVFISGDVSYVGELWFQFITFLTTQSPNGPGWILAGSNDTSSGSMGSNVLSSASSFVSGTWFVLETPDREIQFLFEFTSATATSIYINTYADYFGGGNSVLPSFNTEQNLLKQVSIVTGSGNAGFHCVASDSYPYEFAWISNTYNSSSSRGGMALVFVNDRNEDFYKYVFMGGTAAFSRTQLDSTSQDLASSGIASIFKGVVTQCSFATMGTPGSSLNPVPEDAGHTIVGGDFFTPSFFYLNLYNSFGGSSNFMRWEGTRRANLQTFGNWITFGAVSFPWPGSIIPSYDPK